MAGNRWERGVSAPRRSETVGRQRFPRMSIFFFGGCRTAGERGTRGARVRRKRKRVKKNRRSRKGRKTYRQSGFRTVRQIGGSSIRRQRVAPKGPRFERQGRFTPFVIGIKVFGAATDCRPVGTKSAYVCVCATCGEASYCVWKGEEMCGGVCVCATCGEASYCVWKGEEMCGGVGGCAICGSSSYYVWKGEGMWESVRYVGPCVGMCGGVFRCAICEVMCGGVFRCVICGVVSAKVCRCVQVWGEGGSVLSIPGGHQDQSLKPVLSCLLSCPPHLLRCSTASAVLSAR